MGILSLHVALSEAVRVTGQCMGNNNLGDRLGQPINYCTYSHIYTADELVFWDMVSLENRQGSPFVTSFCIHSQNGINSDRGVGEVRSGACTRLEWRTDTAQINCLPEG